MKYYIAVDCEGGACGVGEPGNTLSHSKKNFDFACLQITREADAAARALYDEGATQVIVWDNHASSLNLHYDLLDERCDIALGQFPHRFPGLDSSFAAVLFIGYHAMDNTAGAVMCHTYSSSLYQWIKINGREVGEIAIDAALAGEKGVPVIFLSSDDKATAEARQFLPHIHTFQTKQAHGYNAAISIHPKRAIDGIHDSVVEAVEQFRTQKPPPYTMPPPLEIELRFKRIDQAESALKNNRSWHRLDAFTLKQTITKISDLF